MDSWKADMRAYGAAVMRHWYLLILGAFSLLALFVSIASDAIGAKLWPWWAWLIVFAAALHLAQFFAWRDVRRERDALHRYHVGQRVLSQIAEMRDFLIQHQNVTPETGTALGAWIEQFKAHRVKVGELLKSKVSFPEFRAYDHIGLFTLYAAPSISTLTDKENVEFEHWRSRIARDHKWLERFIFDYGRQRLRSDLTAITSSDPSEIDEGAE